MAKLTYVFGNLRTGEVLLEASLFGVVPMTTKLNTWGGFSGTFQLDQSGQNNEDLQNAVIPLQNYLVVERDGTPIWGGIIGTYVYQSQSKTIQVFARSFESYFERVKLLSDFLRTNTEQRNIFRDLVNQLQANPETNLGLTVPGSFPTVVPKTLKVDGHERRTYAQAIADIADVNDGFDWRIDIVKTASGAYSREIRVGYPRLGTTDPSGLFFEYPGNITNYYETGSGGQSGTHIFVVGQGEGTANVIGSYFHQDLINTGTWLRFDLDLSENKITDPTTAQSRANIVGPQRKAPMRFRKVFVKADQDPVFGSYTVGDACTLVIKDPQHPLGAQITTRIIALSYKPESSENVEEVELIFEGDELNE